MTRNELKKKNIKKMSHQQILDKFASGAKDTVEMMKQDSEMHGTKGTFSRLKRVKKDCRLRSQHSYSVFDAAAFKNTRKV